MDEADLETFRDLINARLAELESEEALGREGQAVVELDQQAVGRLSRMDALQNQAMAKAGKARRGVETERLHAALARIEAGEFGHCEDCGEPIVEGRLRLDPATLRCVSCAAG
ncbi:TraR/DksA family transcriptional regulator [Rhodobacteraceae bacterium 63075]|nr:TraR/DksA family transcriptional regulator [Rhodobacteraceae bacterium 63075]